MNPEMMPQPVLSPEEQTQHDAKLRHEIASMSPELRAQVQPFLPAEVKLVESRLMAEAKLGAKAFTDVQVPEQYK